MLLRFQPFQRQWSCISCLLIGCHCHRRVESSKISGSPVTLEIALQCGWWEGTEVHKDTYQHVCSQETLSSMLLCIPVTDDSLSLLAFTQWMLPKKQVPSLVTLGLWAFLDFCKGYYIGSIHHVSCWHRSKWILINPMLPYILRRTSISRKISSLHIYWRADHGSIDNKCPMHFFKSSNWQQATSWKYLRSFKRMTVHSCNCHLFINCPNCTIITERSTLSTL